MKKTRLLTAILLVLVTSLCFVQVATVNADVYSVGSFDTAVVTEESGVITAVTEGNAISADYVNTYFVYDASSDNTDATSYYIALKVADLQTKSLPADGQEFYDFAQTNGGMTAYTTHADFVAVLKANEAEADYNGYCYIFSEADSTKTGTEQRETFSAVKSIIFDTKAPVFDSTNYIANEVAILVPSSDTLALTDNFSNYIVEETAKYTLDEIDPQSSDLNVGDYSYSKLKVTYFVLSPSSTYEEDTDDYEEVDDDFVFDSLGWWVFRVKIADLAGNYATYLNSANEEIDYFEYRASVTDTGAPTISVSQTYNTTGVVAGTSISTPVPSLSDNEGSTTSYNYKIYKWKGEDGSTEDIDSNWQLIYDYTDGVVEGFEDEMKSNIILTSVDDAGKGLKVVTTEDSEEVTNYYMYKVLYTGKDIYGNIAYEDDDNGEKVGDGTKLYIKLTAPEETTILEEDPNFVWKVVLISIAVLAACGIIYMIFFYKPRTAASQKAHYGKEQLEELSDEEIDEDAEEVIGNDDKKE